MFVLNLRKLQGSKKKWLPGSEGKGKNEPLGKLVISQPIKSGKEILLDSGS
jgi:hypothetical protein